MRTVEAELTHSVLDVGKLAINLGLILLLAVGNTCDLLKDMRLVLAHYVSEKLG